MNIEPTETEAVIVKELRHKPRDGEDFNACWQRTSRRRFELVRDLGISGVRLWLFADDAHFEILCQPGEVPREAGCPWELPAGIKPVAVVEQVFGPLAEKLPDTFNLLREECRHVFVLRQRGVWRLLYVLPRTQHNGLEYWQFVGGGPPLAKPQLPLAVRDTGWRLPRPLRELYAVHDGFGHGLYDNPFGWSQVLEPCSRLHLLSDYVDTLENGAKYDSRDLLEFFTDGAGNGQYFHRRSPKDDNPPTFDWDHETWQLSGPTDCFDFLDERLLQLVEE